MIYPGLGTVRRVTGSWIVWPSCSDLLARTWNRTIWSDYLPVEARRMEWLCLVILHIALSSELWPGVRNAQIELLWLTREYGSSMGRSMEDKVIGSCIIWLICPVFLAGTLRRNVWSDLFLVGTWRRKWFGPVYMDQLLFPPCHDQVQERSNC